MLSEAQIQHTFELLKVPLSRMKESSPLYFPCPFEHRHTKRSQPRDCQLYFKDGPAVHCFHESCREELAEYMRMVRFFVTGSSRGDFEFQISVKSSPDRKLAAWVEENRSELIREYSGKLELTPVDVSSTELLARLFNSEDILWIGNKEHSGHRRFRQHFKTLAAWLAAPPPPKWSFTTGATFLFGSISRCNEAVAERRYLVLESDRLSRDQVVALFAWVRKELGLKLALVLFSGNESLHAWFKYPGDDWLNVHGAALAAAGFDESTMRRSQAVRLGGALHTNGNKQQILWIRNPPKK